MNDPDHEKTPEPPADRPRVSVKVEEAIAAAAMALICVITFANVVVRYLTDASFAFTEEISVFLLVVLTLVGAAGAFARNRNIRVEFFAAMTSPTVQRWLEIGGLLLTVVLFVMVAWYGARFVVDDWKYETTSPGLGVPQWIYSVWLPVLSLAIAGRALGRIVRLLRARESAMTAVLFLGFLVLLVLGAPLATALGIVGSGVIIAKDLGAMSIATNVYSSLAKYPLLALPVFILAGMIFERVGVAAKLVAFVAALVGRTARLAGRGRHPRVHVPRRHLGFGTGGRRRGRDGDAALDDPAGLPARAFPRR